MKYIVQGRDATITNNMRDKLGNVVSLVGWLIVRVRLEKTDGAALIKSAPVTAGVDEVQSLAVSAVPDSGSIKLKLDDETTAAIAFDATNLEIAAALNLLEFLEGVLVTGDFTTGPVVVTFTGKSGNRNYALLEVVDNVLKEGVNDVTVTPSTTTTGKGQTGVEIVSEEAGKFKVYLNEEDTALLKKGEGDLVYNIRIGESDLNIRPKSKAIKVVENPF